MIHHKWKLLSETPIFLHLYCLNCQSKRTIDKRTNRIVTKMEDYDDYSNLPKVNNDYSNLPSKQKIEEFFIETMNEYSDDNEDYELNEELLDKHHYSELDRKILLLESIGLIPEGHQLESFLTKIKQHINL